MKLLGTIGVALLALHFLDEQCCDSHYTDATATMLSVILRSFL